MSTYLYTWNPKRWNWADQPEAICRIGDGEQYDMYWSCGNTKKITVGDTFFLIKLGVEPKKGKAGSGLALKHLPIMQDYSLCGSEKGPGVFI